MKAASAGPSPIMPPDGDHEYCSPAHRLLQTLVGFPRRAVAPGILTVALRRARWRRAKALFLVMRGLTGILVRLTLYGLAYRLVSIVRGGPFRRRRTIPQRIQRPATVAPAAGSDRTPADQPAYWPSAEIVDFAALGHRRVPGSDSLAR